jgi:hypothetical protein
MLHFDLDAGEPIARLHLFALIPQLIGPDLPQVRLHLPHLFAEKPQIDVIGHGLTLSQIQHQPRRVFQDSSGAQLVLKY